MPASWVGTTWLQKDLFVSWKQLSKQIKEENLHENFYVLRYNVVPLGESQETFRR
jgi:hypothetical protein